MSTTDLMFMGAIAGGLLGTALPAEGKYDPRSHIRLEPTYKQKTWHVIKWGLGGALVGAIVGSAMKYTATIPCR